MQTDNPTPVVEQVDREMAVAIRALHPGENDYPRANPITKPAIGEETITGSGREDGETPA